MSQPSQAPARMSYLRSFLICLGLLVAVLSVLFRANLDPDYVSFSNDAPVGAVHASARAVPGVMTGVWQDLNWLGGPEPIPAPNLSMLIRLSAKALGLELNDIYAPTSLLTVGLCAWLLFWRLRLDPWVCILGGLAATLNSDFLNTACWGVCSQPIAFGMNFLALGALADTESPRRWLRVILAGAAVGLGVTEAYDIGALFSLFTGAYVVAQSLIECGPVVQRIVGGFGRLALVGICAGLVSAAALQTLIGTQIQGVAGTEQDAESKAARWGFATIYSIPKAEALGILVPGLFGFRFDTPDGGVYWGRAGSDLAWDEYFKSDKKGPPPRAMFRAGAGSNYAGLLVILLAIFGVAQSFRKEGSPLTTTERRLVWFWGLALLVALLLMFGRFAPFYQLFYALPYVSTIRNPAKFLHLVEWTLLILSAYGAEALWRTGFSRANVTVGLGPHWKNWWKKAAGFNRKWVFASAAAVIVFAFAWMVYASSHSALEQKLVEYTNLATGGQRLDPFDVEEGAKATARHSIGQVGRTLLFLVPTAAFVALAVSGYFGGRRAQIGGGILTALLLVDLVPVNRHWIRTVNWKEKYESNTVIDYLKQRPYEHRVSLFSPGRHVDLNRLPREIVPTLQQFGLFSQLYGAEWTQHLFQFYNVQTLDIIQEPRKPVDKAAYEAVMSTAPSLRLWELTNTRYLIGPAPFLEFLNQQMDGGRNRFGVALQFGLASKPGAGPSGPTAEQITTVVGSNAPIALFDFTGALPRAKLYTNWKVSTNDTTFLQNWAKTVQQQPGLPQDMRAALASQSLRDLATLHELANPAFDPAQTVLLTEPLRVSPSPNQTPGEVKFESYSPKHIVLSAKATAPSVLLLNDKFDPNWRVLVDGKSAPLLRCNYIMRGVQLPPGEHQIEFHFAPSLNGLYVSLVALVLGAALLGYLGVCAPRTDDSPTSAVVIPENRPARPK